MDGVAKTFSSAHVRTAGSPEAGSRRFEPAFRPSKVSKVSGARTYRPIEARFEGASSASGFSTKPAIPAPDPFGTTTPYFEISGPLKQKCDR